MNEDKITQEYYANTNTKQFYLELWGEDSIHIGLYEENYNYNDNKEQKIKDIKTAINKKKEYMVNYIKRYCNFKDTLNISDFGSGFGGTSRYIYNKLNKTNNLIIDNFDISNDNCEINIKKNIEQNMNINVYNMSFLNTHKPNNYYDIIYSEDSFIHINNRNLIFEEINRILKKDGILIFSDIILTDQYNKNNINEVYDRVKIKSLETHRSYLEKAKKHNFVYINSLEYNDSMFYHYKNIRDLIKENIENKKIISGLDNWIKHINIKNITSKIFIFKKN